MPFAHFMSIPGRFVITGKEPDGDSVRFIATDLTHFQQIKNHHRLEPARTDGSVQLRFEAVDAPEVHYGTAAQPLANPARDALLHRMGFGAPGEIGFSGNRVTGTPRDLLPGCILTQAVETNGRPVSYVLVGDAAQGLPDGDLVEVDPALLSRSINAWLLESGHAYYTAYTSTPPSHRELLREAARAARSANRGVWARDTSRQFELTSAASLGPEGQLILPKLFRRATDYLKDRDRGAFMGELADWMVWKSTLSSRSEDDRVVLNDRVEVPLHTLLVQQNSRVSFQPDLLEIVFVEK